MSKTETTDFEAAAEEAFSSYLDQKFPNKELRRISFAEPIGFIRAGFFLGIKFVKNYYSITRK